MLSPRGVRCGMDRLLVHVQQVLDQVPFDGGAYVFRNRADTRIKVPCCDGQGTWLAVRRLQHGRFVWPRSGASTWTLSAEQFS